MRRKGTYQADVAPACETEADAEDTEPDNAPAGCHPDAQHADQAHDHHGDHRVEAADVIGNVARAPAAEEGTCVDDG